MSYLSKIQEPMSIITAIENGTTYPDVYPSRIEVYLPGVLLFQSLIEKVTSSGDLLREIRDNTPNAKIRMTLLKLFRRCVCLSLDTEAAKKITKLKTDYFIEHLGDRFKPIALLKNDFSRMTPGQLETLAVLIGEHDGRGKQGYDLTDHFFSWFETQFPSLSIAGPRGAGRDIEFSSIFPDFLKSCPCDFIITTKSEQTPLAVGFARYDSTRGGSQSDDRTGGNADKVNKIEAFCRATDRRLRIVFLAEGPGLVHKDTWSEACTLDDSWDGSVRVVTLKIAHLRITSEWLMG